jgi:hypothetical protein
MASIEIHFPFFFPSFILRVRSRSRSFSPLISRLAIIQAVETKSETASPQRARSSQGLARLGAGWATSRKAPAAEL